MKEIKAYLHARRIADVLRALEQSGQLGRGGRLGVSTLSVSSVNGLLPPLDERERHYSLDLAHEVIREVKLEVMCEDDQVDAIVALIAGAAQTGQAQAGWVYVCDVLRAIPFGRGAGARGAPSPARIRDCSGGTRDHTWLNVRPYRAMC